MSVTIQSEPNAETGERGHAIAEVANDQQSRYWSRRTKRPAGF